MRYELVFKERRFHGVIVKTTLRFDKINMHKFNNPHLLY